MVNTGSEELWEGLRQGDNENERLKNAQDSLNVHEPQAESSFIFYTRRTSKYTLLEYIWDKSSAPLCSARSLRKLVTSRTWSPTMTQQSLSVLCLATSSALTDMLTYLWRRNIWTPKRDQKALSQNVRQHAIIYHDHSWPIYISISVAYQQQHQEAASSSWPDVHKQKGCQELSYWCP